MWSDWNGYKGKNLDNVVKKYTEKVLWLYDNAEDILFYPNPRESMFLSKGNYTQFLDEIAKEVTGGPRPKTEILDATQMRKPRKGEVGKVEGSECKNAVVFEGVSDDVWETVKESAGGSRKFKFLLQQFVDALSRIEVRVFMSGLWVVDVVVTNPEPGKEKESLNQGVLQYIRASRMLPAATLE